MPAFDPEQFLAAFVSKPSYQVLQNLLRVRLISLAQHLNLPATIQMLKPKVLELVTEYFIEQEILPETHLEQSNIGPSEFKEIALAKIQAQQETTRMEMQIKQAELDMQERMKAMDLEIARARGGAATLATLPEPRPREAGHDTFDVTKHLKMVPKFDEENLESFFDAFSKVARSLAWPENKYIILLQSVLKGRAQETYAAMSYEDCQNFDTVKEAILKAYELVPESYRQKFRKASKKEGQSFYELVQDK